MLTTPNIGVMLALFLVMAGSQFKDKKLQMVCLALAPILILFFTNMLTMAAWELYSPALLMLFVLFTVYTHGETKMVSMLVSMVMFTSLLNI